MILSQTNKNVLPSTSKRKIQLLLEAGVERHQQGQLAAANLIYEKIRQLDPDNPTALQLSGVLASQAGQQEISITLLSRAISLKPDYSEAFNHRGVTHKKLGNFAEALGDYNRAIELSPKYADALYNRGIIFQEMNILVIQINFTNTKEKNQKKWKVPVL